jgi:hypothetical protein
MLYFCLTRRNDGCTSNLLPFESKSPTLLDLVSEEKKMLDLQRIRENFLNSSDNVPSLTGVLPVSVAPLDAKPSWEAVWLHYHLCSLLSSPLYSPPLHLSVLSPHLAVLSLPLPLRLVLSSFLAWSDCSLYPLRSANFICL